MRKNAAWVCILESGTKRQNAVSPPLSGSSATNRSVETPVSLVRSSPTPQISPMTLSLSAFLAP